MIFVDLGNGDFLAATSSGPGGINLYGLPNPMPTVYAHGGHTDKAKMQIVIPEWRHTTWGSGWVYHLDTYNAAWGLIYG